MEGITRSIYKLYNTVTMIFGKLLYGHVEFRDFYEVLHARCAPPNRDRKVHVKVSSQRKTQHLLCSRSRSLSLCTRRLF